MSNLIVVLGLGVMGFVIVVFLIEYGEKVVVWNRSLGKV